MRKLIFSINITADGYCDHTLFNPEDEVLDYFTHLMREVDGLLYGRTTYEMMFPYWPEIARNQAGETKAENEFAQAISAVPQIFVASRTLKFAEGTKATLLRGDIQDEIKRIKSQPGKSISTGGVSFSSELLELGLIDEFRLVVHPLFSGKGRRLFDGAHLQEKLQLRLVDSYAFRSGVMALRYQKAF